MLGLTHSKVLTSDSKPNFVFEQTITYDGQNGHQPTIRGDEKARLIVNNTNNYTLRAYFLDGTYQNISWQYACYNGNRFSYKNVFRTDLDYITIDGTGVVTTSLTILVDNN